MSNLILRSARSRARLEGWQQAWVEQAAILRDGRPSKSAVADFDTFGLPKSGKPDFGGRPPQDEGLILLRAPSRTMTSFASDTTNRAS